MRTISRVIITTLTILLFAHACIDDNIFEDKDIPVIESINPDSAYVNDIIIIRGKKFHSSLEGNIVRFGEDVAKIVSATDSVLEVVAPNGTGEVNITVTTNAGKSLGKTFRFLIPQLHITEIIPGSGMSGDIVEIRGDAFDNNPDNNLVRFDEVVAEVVSATKTSLQVKVPESKGLVNVTVAVGRNKSNAVEFRYEVANTTLTAVEPNAAFAGDKVLLKGTFRSPLTSNVVKFGSAIASIEKYADTELEVIVPPGSGTVNVTVSFETEISSPISFTYATIELNSLSKSSGEVGDTITLLGNGFSDIIANNTVKFGNNIATVVSVSQTKNELKVIVPVFADGNPDVQVLVQIGTDISNALSFHLLQYFIETIAGSGVVGSSTSPVNAMSADMNQPVNLTFDAAGNMYIAEATGAVVRKLMTTDNKIHFIAGKYNVAGNADGTGANATFQFPYDLAVDNSGNIYVADVTNKLIRKITASGVVTTLAGQVGSATAANGIGTAATFRNPYAVALDLSGHLLIGDEFSVRRLNLTTLEVTTVSADDMNAATTSVNGHRRVTGLAVDKAGNIYTCERMNNSIKKISPDGTVSILAGPSDRTLIGHVDGAGSVARFFNPSGLAIDSKGNLYVADGTNVAPYNYYIRKITKTGIVSTIAGIGAPPPPYVASGIGISVPIRSWGLAVDADDNIYVTDQGNQCIRKLHLK